MKISKKKVNLLHVLAAISMILAVINAAWWGICAVAWRTPIVLRRSSLSYALD